jgi:DNA-binding MarR family transcriptional regulator
VRTVSCVPMTDPTQKVTRRRSVPRTVTRRELLVGDSDDVFRHFVHGLLAFSERLMAVRQGFGQMIGLSGIEYTVLVSIAHLQVQDQVSVGAVAEHLHLSGAFLTTVTNQLVRKGLIRKSRSPADRRRASLVTTPHGVQLLQRLAPVQQRVNDALFGPLTRSQFHDLAGEIEALVQSANRAIALLRYLRTGDGATVSEAHAPLESPAKVKLIDVAEREALARIRPTGRRTGHRA